MAQLKVRDENGAGVQGIGIRIAIGSGSSDEAVFDVVTDKEGNQGWPIPFWPIQRYALHVNMREANGTPLRHNPLFGETRVIVDHGNDVDIVLPTAENAPATGELERLVRIDTAAHRFITESGRPQFLRGTTSYLLYKRFLDGEDLRPLLDQYQELGINLVRLFGMVTSFAHWHPQEYLGRGYYQRIPEFMDLTDSFGQYVLWTACADTGAIMPNENESLGHMRQTLEQLRPKRNKLFSFVNEQGQHENGINRARAFAELRGAGLLDGLMFDTGSFGEDAPCEAPFGTHVVLHVRRAYPSHVKDCCVLDHPNRVNAPHLEVLLDEPDRYGEGGNMSLENARDSAATSYTSLGFVFHSADGVQSRKFSGRTLEMARTVFPILRGF